MVENTTATPDEQQEQVKEVIEAPVKTPDADATTKQELMSDDEDETDFQECLPEEDVLKQQEPVPDEDSAKAKD